MFTWQWHTWWWRGTETFYVSTAVADATVMRGTDIIYVYMAMADLVMRAREHWHNLCLHGDDRPSYEGQGALTQFMFTWWWQTWFWGPGSTDTLYVYMVMADLVLRAREHWHSLCLHGDGRPVMRAREHWHSLFLHGDGRLGYNEALTQFMFVWQWQKQRLWLPVVHWGPDPWSNRVLHHAELGPHSGESHFPFIFALLL